MNRELPAHARPLHPATLRPCGDDTPLALWPPGTEPVGDDAALGFEAAGIGLVVTDAQWHILAVNAAYARRGGRGGAELSGSRLTLPPARGTFASCAAPPRPGQRWEGEVDQRDGEGRTWTAWVRVEPVCGDDGALVRHVVSFTDVSALKREHEVLRHRAHHDPLTGLANRELFDAELARSVERARRRGRRLAVLSIDLDHFKWVNDTLGHAAGDALLGQVGTQLRLALRAEDLVARIGGDEFAALLDDVGGAAAAAAAAASLMAALGRPFPVDGHALNVAASIGIALFPDDGTDRASLARAADAAMYESKRLGRGRFTFGARRAPPR